jgi:hypothetical protein
VRDKKKRTNNNHTKKTNHTAKRKPVETELMEFTFDQKKDLSEQINNLTGDRLNTVVNIIQNSMPNLDGVSDSHYKRVNDDINNVVIIARTRGNCVGYRLT